MTSMLDAFSLCDSIERGNLIKHDYFNFSWKDRAESAMEGNGMLKTQLSEMREIVDKLEEHAFAKDTEIKYLKSRVESFEVLTLLAL